MVAVTKVFDHASEIPSVHRKPYFYARIHFAIEKKRVAIMLRMQEENIQRTRPLRVVPVASTSTKSFRNACR